MKGGVYTKDGKWRILGLQLQYPANSTCLRFFHFYIGRQSGGIIYRFSYKNYRHSNNDYTLSRSKCSSKCLQC